ncbi:MAG: histidine phosphatase family protein [Nocardioides sp.]|nr:histidine phosphatase family protein [Nocardioides sp.]
MTRRLVLLRHGRTEWNHRGRVQGQQDVSLDDTGRSQAAAVAPVMAAMAPALLWCSDLARTRETAEPLAAVTGLVPTYDARLREFFFGDRERLTHAEYLALDPEGYQEFRRGNYDATPGAEPTAEVRKRMVAALEDLLADLGPGQTGVVVSHGAAIRVATAAMLGWPEDQFHTLRGLDNCGWAVLEEDPWVGELRLGSYNRGL